MTKKSETKKQLEAILGHKLGDDAVQLIQFVQLVASSTNMRGSITQRHLVIQRPNSCYETDLLDVSGFAITASNGQSVFKLTDFLCPTGDRFFAPVNVVATPFSTAPCYLTVVHSLLNNGADVEIKVFAWDVNGAAAPNITFNWRCRVDLHRIFL